MFKNKNNGYYKGFRIKSKEDKTIIQLTDDTLMFKNPKEAKKFIQKFKKIYSKI